MTEQTSPCSTVVNIKWSRPDNFQLILTTCKSPAISARKTTKQKGNASLPQRKVVLNRPVPFSGISSAAAGASRSGGDKPHRRHRRRRSTNGADSTDEEDGGGGIVRAHAHALHAFRFLCRSGQLFLAEQLALSGVWDAGKTDSNGGSGGGGGDDRNTGDRRVNGWMFAL